MLRAELDYSCEDGVCLHPDADEVLEQLRGAPTDDAWLVDEAELLASIPHDWATHWDVLLARAGFHRFGTQLASRDTTKARVKAAMIDLGRPATRDEIAKQAEFPEEPPARLSALLSGLPSVGRAGKDTWALLDRIDDVYEGIPTEITQRIHEDGGATTLSRLLEELPRKFGVSESSVRTYVATPQFTLRDGFVSVADESTLKYRDFEDVIDGRTDSGDPFWEFTVESRFFEGYSVLGFPPELARHLGCEPNGSIRVNISAPEQCRPISVIWRLASSTGASVGYLMDPLQALGVDSGSQVRLVFVSGSTVRFEAVDRPTRATTSGTVAGDLLERLKQRRQVL